MILRSFDTLRADVHVLVEGSGDSWLALLRQKLGTYNKQLDLHHSQVARGLQQITDRQNDTIAAFCRRVESQTAVLESRMNNLDVRVACDSATLHQIAPQVATSVSLAVDGVVAKIGADRTSRRTKVHAPPTRSEDTPQLSVQVADELERCRATIAELRHKPRDLPPSMPACTS